MRRLFPWPGELEVRDELVAERTRRRQLDREVARLRREVTDTGRMVVRLRQLLLEVHAPGSLKPTGMHDWPRERLLDTVLAAAEGREFEDLVGTSP